MALAVPTIASAIESAFVAQYGPPIDPLEFGKFKTALANALFQVLTVQATIAVTTTGVTGVGTPGGPLPILAQPGTGTIV
jgi:hypothetical protein